MSTCLKCDNPTVEPAPESGGSVSASQMYCAYHLEHLNDNGDWNPIQVPIPVN